jgi:hypothetical protein
VRLQLIIDDIHQLDVTINNSSELTFHVDNEHEFRERLAALVGMRAPGGVEFESAGSTSWVDFSFPIESNQGHDFNITLFVPDDLAPSEARAMLAEVQEALR